MVSSWWASMVAARYRFSRLTAVARVVVSVMPKPEILDPQGKAVLGALPRLGFDGVTDVRQGKRFELEVPEVTDAVLAEIDKLAETFLANTVIENYTVTVEANA
jgi:phosphoribosylformylglycinamidine synthase